MKTQVNFDALGGGGGTLDYEEFTATWTKNQTITIPTTKKARGIAFVSSYYGSNVYQMICVDGVNDNYIYINNAGSSESWGVKMKFNDNNIESLTSASSNTTFTITGYILY